MFSLSLGRRFWYDGWPLSEGSARQTAWSDQGDVHSCILRINQLGKSSGWFFLALYLKQCATSLMVWRGVLNPKTYRGFAQSKEASDDRTEEEEDLKQSQEL